MHRPVRPHVFHVHRGQDVFRQGNVRAPAPDVRNRGNSAAIDDFLALLALSVSVGLVSGTLSYYSIFVVMLKAVAFLVLGALIGRFVIVKLMKRFSDSKLAEKYPESVFLFAMMIAFFYALIAELVGLSAIVGAFLAGISLAGVKVKHGNIFKEGADHLQIIFASIFLHRWG